MSVDVTTAPILSEDDPGAATGTSQALADDAGCSVFSWGTVSSGDGAAWSEAPVVIVGFVTVAEWSSVDDDEWWEESVCGWWDG